MLLKYQSADGNHHWITATQAGAFLGCSRRTLDNYRTRSDTYGARLLRAHATGRLLPEPLGIWWDESRRRLLTSTGAAWELHELTQPAHWAAVQAATIADLKRQLRHKETENMELQKSASVAFAALALASCASAPDPKDYPAHVIPLTGGQYQSTAEAYGDPKAATQAATIYARGQCDDIGKRPAVVNAEHDSNEPKTEAGKWGSALATLGAALYAHNTDRYYSAGSYTYRTTLRFTCEATEATE
ncbi:MAG: hypothetical protein AMXMBFR26_06850 [Porticoccaceae bacterium]